MKSLLIFLVLFIDSLFVISQSVVLKYPLDSVLLVKMENELCKPLDEKLKNKAINTNYWLLDSVVSNRVDVVARYPRLRSFKYDSKGNEIETIEKDSPYPFSWWKAEYSYNNMNRISKIIQYEGFDTITNSYIPHVKVLYSYATDGKLVHHSWFYWNVNQHKFMSAAGEFVYYYDVNNRLIKKVLSFNHNGTMEFSSKYLYAYDQYDNIWLSRSYEWNNGSWHIFEKKERSYSGKNLLDSSVYMHYSLANANDTEGRKTVYYRDANQVLISSKIFAYNKNTHSFNTTFYSSTNYNSKGNPILERRWSNNMVVRKNVYTYDYYDNLVSTSSYSINSNGDLALNIKTDAYLNYYISSDQVILPKYFIWVDLDVNLLERKHSYLLDNYSRLSNFGIATPASNVDYAHYYYSQKNIVGIDNQYKRTTVKVFPNPLQSQFQFMGLIEGKEYRLLVYDIQGSELMNCIVHKGENIDAGLLAKGVYVYRLLGNQNILNGKLIIQ